MTDIAEFVDLHSGVVMKYRAGTADEKVLAHSFSNDIFLREVPEYRPRPTDVIIDVGAHIGTFTCLMAGLVRQGRVVAVEACQDTFDLLEQNLAQNSFNHVFAIKCALMDRDGVAKLYHDLSHGNWGHSAIAQLSGEWEEVESISLSTLFKRADLKKVDLMRMNCEGAEFPILLNATAEILQKISCILILHHEYLDPDFSSQSLERHLRSAGFTIRRARTTPGEGWIIASRMPAPAGAMFRYRMRERLRKLRSVAARIYRGIRRILSGVSRKGSSRCY
jgi:FkbM family methyltransferase